MLGVERLTKHVKAPQADGGLLAEPPFPDYERMVSENRRRLAFLAGEVGTLSWAEFRAQARAELLGQSIPADQPRLMAGHQPELFHPGVWAKNFVLAGQAKRLGANAVNLIVDNDTFKHRVLSLPMASTNPQNVELESTPFDVSAPELPYEEAFPRDWAALESWPDKLRPITDTWNFQPMVFAAWPRIVGCLKTGVSYTRAFVSARQYWERKWGGGTPEVAVSQVASHDSFSRFCWQLMVDAKKFATVYNNAIVDYRSANGIKSKNHPAPELLISGDMVETPFWIWRLSDPTRRRVFVRVSSQAIKVFAGNTELAMTLSPQDESTRGIIHNSGWKLRPRALTLTLYSRLALADLFIHGIGGGKYDEVTDEIIRRYFGIEPPEYAVVSATIRLPLDRFAADGETLRSQQRLIRNLTWNPQYFDEARRAAPALADAKWKIALDRPNDRKARREWFRTLADLTARMRPATAPLSTTAAEKLAAIAAELDANAVLGRRDFSWVFYPESLLEERFRPLLG